MQIRLFQVDAFASRLFRGNPAAVCPLEEWLPDGTLQAIAAENNLSETAFFVPEGERFRIRWFTPVAEVDLCGHATLASGHVLFRHLGYSKEEIIFDSRSGELRVGREGEKVVLDFPALPAVPCAPPPALAAGLGGSPLEFHRADDYLVLYGTEEEILSLAPDFTLLRGLDLRGVVVTAPGREVDFVSRFFAPALGIDEDPVTGSAHCTLAPFWAARLSKDVLSARQLSRRTGELACALRENRVLIAGEAVTYLEGLITF